MNIANEYLKTTDSYYVLSCLISMQKISFVIPLYNEEANILPLCEQLLAVIHRDFKNWVYEIIFVDDGSKDKSRDKILECVQQDSCIVGIQLRRNYGQSIALDAGFQKASWDIIVSLDGDLQNDPNDIKKLYNKLESEQLDIVAGWRKSRKDPLWMLIITWFAKYLRRFLINDGVHDSGCTLRVYRREVIRDLYLWWEMHRYIIAISKINGYKVGELEVHHRPRIAGNTKYTWKKSIRGTIDLIYIRFLSKFQSRSLHLFGGSWIIFIVIGVFSLTISLYQKSLDGINLNRNWFFFMGFFWWILGIFLFVMGMMMDVIIKTYYNTSREPRYLIKTTTWKNV